MIVADTSALVSLATAGLTDVVLSEFDVHTSETVVAELEATAEYDDPHGAAAGRVLDALDRIEVHDVGDEPPESSRIDAGEGSAVVLARESGAQFLLTDDLRALPELQSLVDAEVAISPIVLRALVDRGVLDEDEAVARLDRLADRRDWLGAPIYRRARRLFE